MIELDQIKYELSDVEQELKELGASLKPEILEARVSEINGIMEQD